jgi:hypothetical protein
MDEHASGRTSDERKDKKLSGRTSAMLPQVNFTVIFIRGAGSR